ncbi:MAG: ATP-binding protein [Lachnospiraceae bacterium]
MPLKNSQYNALMRDYNRKQLENRRQQQERFSYACKLIPRLGEIDSEIATRSANQAKKLIAGDIAALDNLRKEVALLKREKYDLLAQAGLPADYLDLHYDCPNCKDTGYVNGEKCHCLKQAAVDLLYTQSNIREVLEKENFNTLDFKFYSKDIHPSLGRSTYDYMSDVVTRCKLFAQNFSREKGNILFTGTTGVGKTFLSNCIAKEVIDQCNSVVYLTATEIFDIFAKGMFSYDEDARDHIDQYILDSDLLIIDDLGTELANTFTTGRLFYCINERALRKKGTIISSNLKPSEIRDIYSERIASRILSSYQIITLFGNDIRITKKFGKA